MVRRRGACHRVLLSSPACVDRWGSNMLFCSKFGVGLQEPRRGTFWTALLLVHAPARVNATPTRNIRSPRQKHQLITGPVNINFRQTTPKYGRVSGGRAAQA
eukprot:7387025-Prymnesium_polylepis.2